MTTSEIIEYYVELLIKQYSDLPSAAPTVRAWVNPPVMPQVTVQTLVFSPNPDSGDFTLGYDGVGTAAIHWNEGTLTVRNALRAISGLEDVEANGSVFNGKTAVTFIGVTPPAIALTVLTNTLLGGATPVEITIAENETLPLAVQNGFNLLGDDTAIGAQLDILGKYAGVTRSGTNLSGNFVTLGDEEFLILIQMAIITNNAGSSLETIQNLLHQFFPGLFQVTDYQNMRLSYLISNTIGGSDLIQLMLVQGLLPKPMGVQLSVTVVPDFTILYAFRTYAYATPNGKPFNRYGAWDFTWRWLSYRDII